MLAARDAYSFVGAVLKRQDVCATECSVALDALNNSPDIATICTSIFFYSLQLCVNCLAASGTRTVASITAIEQSAADIADNCNRSGRPVSGLTTPPVAPLSTRNIPTPSTSSSIPFTPPPTPTPSVSASSSGSDPPVAAIVGGVVGGVAVLAIIGILIFLIMRKRHTAAPHSTAPPSIAPMSQTPNQDTNSPNFNSPGYFPTSPTNSTAPPQMLQPNNYPAAQALASGAYTPTNSSRWSTAGPPPQGQFSGAFSQYPSGPMMSNSPQTQTEYMNQMPMHSNHNIPPDNRMSMYSSYPASAASPTSNSIPSSPTSNAQHTWQHPHSPSPLLMQPPYT